MALLGERGALCVLVSLLKVRYTAALYNRSCVYAVENFIIRLQGRSYGADGLDLASAVRLFLAVTRVV